MDLERIKSLIDAMAASDLAEMEFSEGAYSLRLVRHAGEARTPAVEAARPPARTARPAAPANPATISHDILAPMFGIVYLRPAPDAADFVRPGQPVSAGAILCVIEAMKVFNEVRATRGGVIADILVPSGHEVDAGQPLIRFQPPAEAT